MKGQTVISPIHPAHQKKVRVFHESFSNFAPSSSCQSLKEPEQAGSGIRNGLTCSQAGICQRKPATGSAGLPTTPSKSLHLFVLFSHMILHPANRVMSSFDATIQGCESELAIEIERLTEISNRPEIYYAIIG